MLFLLSIEFDLGGLANVFDMPGVSLLLRHVGSYFYFFRIFNRVVK